MNNNNQWIVRIKPNPIAKMKLYCFPYSGATASVYFPWAEILPSIIEINSIQLPGHGNRISETLITNLDEMVGKLLSSFQPGKNESYAFFGHSLGALLSFEFLRALRKEKYPMPKILFVSGHGGPQIPDLNPNIHTLPDVDFDQKLREINGMTKDVLENRELMELLKPILRADFEVCERYIYKQDPPFDFPIIAFGGLQDPYVSRGDLEGWQQQTSQKCSIRMFPGDHFYLHSARMMLLQVIAREIAPFLV